MSRRFEALDALRGICALMVALFHFRTAGTLSSLPFIRNGWMFVDFFFVLSGFVIAHAYSDKLSEGYSSLRFLGLRLGRIYPLHLFMLLVFVGVEIVLLTGSHGVTSRSAFGPGKTVADLLITAFLLNSSGASPSAWNTPSWSIAAEMWAYVMFALMVPALGKRAWIAFAVLATASASILFYFAPEWLASTSDFGTIRCFYGFSLGVLLQHFTKPGKLPFATLIEVGVCVAVLGFASFASGPVTLLAPLLFAVAVYVFASEGGFVSASLKMELPLYLGAISYSVYMTHIFVEARVFDAFQYIGLAKANPDYLNASPAFCDMVSLVTLAAICMFAGLTYRFVEVPCREWSRRKLSNLRTDLGTDRPSIAVNVPRAL